MPGYRNLSLSHGVQLSQRPVCDVGNSSCTQKCPRCNSPVFRVSRRLPDVILSVFVKIRRYRCISMKCDWEGNMREAHRAAPQ